MLRRGQGGAGGGASGGCQGRYGAGKSVPGAGPVGGERDGDPAPSEGEASRDLEDVIAEALPGGESLASAAYEGAGGMQEVGGVEGEEPAGLVGPEGVEGGGRGVDPSPPVMVLGTGRGREPDLEGTVQLPEVAFGVATPGSYWVDPLQNVQG